MTPKPLSTENEPVSRGRWDSPAPFQDTISIEMQGHSGMTPVDECKHSYFRVSGADRYHCPHCGAVFFREP